MRSTQRYIEKISEEFEEKIEDWDRINCEYCGKEISMLTAKLVIAGHGYEYFICENGCEK